MLLNSRAYPCRSATSDRELEHACDPVQTAKALLIVRCHCALECALRASLGVNLGDLDLRDVSLGPLGPGQAQA